MNNHRYQLQKYKGKKTKFQCPVCHDKHSFVKYIDTQTGQYLSDNVGRCDHEGKCGYHYKPNQFFTENMVEIYGGTADIIYFGWRIIGASGTRDHIRESLKIRIRHYGRLYADGLLYPFQRCRRSAGLVQKWCGFLLR